MSAEGTMERWLRAATAFVWIATAVSVFHPSYRDFGAIQLARIHLPAWLMYLACAGELVLGLWVLVRRPTLADTGAQLAAIAFFTVILAISHRQLLVHPYGVLTKNLPMGAVIVAAYLLRRDGWSARVRWVLRAGVAAIWITEGLFPKILFQQQMELDVVAGSGLVPMDAGAFLVILGAAQAASGVAILLLRGEPLRWLLGAQAIALVILPAVVSARDPTLWVHPFGPMIKNAPIIVATLCAMRPCNSSS